MPELNPDDVRQAVTRFWSDFASKKPLEEYYSFDARVFGSMATRLEYGRLAALRRQREYCNPETVIQTRITSPIDIIVRETTAIACYTYDFHTVHARIGLKKAVKEDVENGRVTHVFALDDSGQLRIIHEHVSEADTWTQEEKITVAAGAGR